MFIILLNLHVWEKYDSQVKCKNASTNQIAGFLNFSISKTIASAKLIFYMQVHIC